MNQETLTLDKLIVLYILDRVTFPLTTAHISEFILDKEYTNSLTLQTAISELTETGLAESRTILNRTQLQITEEGRSTLHFFENRISDAIKCDIIDYFKNHKLELRNESSIQSNFYKLVNGEFEAQLVAKDKDVDGKYPDFRPYPGAGGIHLRQLAEKKQRDIPVPYGTALLIRVYAGRAHTLTLKKQPRPRKAFLPGRRAVSIRSCHTRSQLLSFFFSQSLATGYSLHRSL